MNELRLEALGTSCHLLAASGSRQELAEAADWIRALGDRLTRFSRDSELSRFNAAAGVWTAVSGELEALLRAALWAFEASGGLVHVGVLEAVVAAGYGRPLREGPTPVSLTAPPPPLPEVLEVRPGRARVAGGAGIDLGGLAKGWMADRLAERLGGSCLVNLGGDLFARGDGPGDAGWPVGFGGRTVLLRDLGAATSSVRRRHWLDGGRNLHHLIDPRTGQPAETGVEEVSVIAPSGLEAEVLAKTALLLGRNAEPAYLAGHALGWALPA